MMLIFSSLYGIHQTYSFQDLTNEFNEQVFILNYTTNSQNELIKFLRNKSNECINDLYAEQWNNTLCKRELYRKEVERPKFIKVAEQIANQHEYDAENYNCQDYSRDLVKALNFIGYDADRVFGRLKNCDPDEDEFECYHQWVRLNIFIESTTGEIIEPDNYKENYEPIRIIS